MNSQGAPEPKLDSRVTSALSQVVDVLNEHKSQYALIGGLAVALRGNVRATQDVDILLHVPQLQLPPLLESIRDSGCELNVVESIREWNDGGMLAIQWPGPVQIDLLKAVIPGFHRILERAIDEPFGDQLVRVADAEGLLLLKLLAFRPLDQEDIRGILAKSAGGLDLNWVLKRAEEVGLEQERLEEFQQLVKDFHRPDGEG